MSKCKKCEYYIYATRLCSMDKPIWGCQFGFKPSKNCKEMALYNVQNKKAYYNKHPELLQLKLNF